MGAKPRLGHAKNRLPGMETGMQPSTAEMVAGALGLTCWHGLAKEKCGDLPLQRGAHGAAPERAQQERATSQSHLRSHLEPKQTSHMPG